VTLQKYFSHPSLVISFFPPIPTRKTKTGTASRWEGLYKWQTNPQRCQRYTLCNRSQFARGKQGRRDARRRERERERTARGPMGVDDEEDMYFINF